MTPNHLNIVIRPLTRDEALAVAAWRYGGELAMYDGEPGQEEPLLVMTAEGYGYYALVQNDDLVSCKPEAPRKRQVHALVASLMMAQ